MELIACIQNKHKKSHDWYKLNEKKIAFISLPGLMQNIRRLPLKHNNI